MILSAIRRMARAGLAGGIALLADGVTARAGADASRVRIEECVVRAAQHHRVNHAVLRAILGVESNLNPDAVGRNADGSVDLGIAQINSRHFAALARHGIHPAQLMDGCVGAYVAAWHLSGLIATHGNSWAAIARYHSATPKLNRRYQLLLARQLASAGVIGAGRLPAAPAGQAGRRPDRDRSDPEAAAPAMVFDDSAASGHP